MELTAVPVSRFSGQEASRPPKKAKRQKENEQIIYTYIYVVSGVRQPVSLLLYLTGLQELRPSPWQEKAQDDDGHDCLPGRLEQNSTGTNPSLGEIQPSGSKEIADPFGPKSREFSNQSKIGLNCSPTISVYIQGGIIPSHFLTKIPSSFSTLRTSVNSAFAKLISQPTPHTTTMQENTSPEYRSTYLSQLFDAATIYPVAHVVLNVSSHSGLFCSPNRPSCYR